MASSASHHMMLEVMPLPAALVHTDGRLAARNTRLRQVLLHGHEELEPDSIHEFLPAEQCRNIADGNMIQGFRTRHALNGSKPLWIEWSSRVWPQDDSLVLLAGIDVTREVDLENYITGNQWFETAAALSGGLAHDFNNALAGILGLSEIISLRLPGDSPLHNFTSRISASVDRAKTIVRRFSQFSRKSTGVVDAQPTAMIAEELLPLLKAYMPSNVVVTAEINPETPWCNADRHEIEHVVLNCCTFFRARLRADGGSLRIACGPASTHKGAEIQLSASCPGFSTLAIDRAFDLDLKPSDTAYDSGSAVFTARKLAESGKCSLRLRRDDPPSLSFVLELPPADEV
ncbi:MAG: histidine kinase dimerization/phospho-acceptor domain-containing protein [Opitutaceae bacterium]